MRVRLVRFGYDASDTGAIWLAPVSIPSESAPGAPTHTGGAGPPSQSALPRADDVPLSVPHVIGAGAGRQPEVVEGHGAASPPHAVDQAGDGLRGVRSRRPDAGRDGRAARTRNGVPVGCPRLGAGDDLPGLVHVHGGATDRRLSGAATSTTRKGGTGSEDRRGTPPSPTATNVPHQTPPFPRGTSALMQLGCWPGREGFPTRRRADPGSSCRHMLGAIAQYERTRCTLGFGDGGRVGGLGPWQPGAVQLVDVGRPGAPECFLDIVAIAGAMP